MKLELIYSEGCHTWKEALKLLKEIIEEKQLDLEIRMVKVETQEDADAYHYFGSPQININGKDIDPMAEKVADYKVAGCRLYNYEGKLGEYPPKKMLEEAIEAGKN